MTKRIALTVAATGAAAAAVAVAAAGGGARAQDAGPRTLALVAHEQRCASADSGRRGDSHTRPRSEWAITGGTGQHAGAGGSVVLQQLSATRTTATIMLVP